MGRFAHKAVAIDPSNGHAHLIEDGSGKSGFYRYIPDVHPDQNRGEGIWYDAGKMYVMDISGGNVGRGAIWELDLASQLITCIYASASEVVGDVSSINVAVPEPESYPLMLVGLAAVGWVARRRKG